MGFPIGSKVIADGDVYEVRGRIQFRNQEDGCTWDEYRLFSTEFQAERWLSVDETYREYSLSKLAWQVSTMGYHKVDEGVAEVVAVWGDADAEVGDTVAFTEYEDITEEKIISMESWDGEKETSTGYYLDAHEFGPYDEYDGTPYVVSGFNSGGYMSGGYSSGGYNSGGTKKRSKAMTTAIMLLFLVCNFGLPIFGVFLGAFGSSNTIKKNLDKSSYFTYVTSLTGTGDSKNADVYKSSHDLDATVRWIIDGIDGNTQNVQQNTEDGDNSVAILTSKEYCLVYESEDNEVLVQVSSREYAYANDSQPYRSRRRTHRYYRRYYYSNAYYSDSSSYSSKYSSPYSSFSDSTISYNSADTYSTYSSSVRQSSVSSRSSSGGGLSSGK